ncbi:glycosyltransferase [Raineyella fluvialis]|uniref:Glycosyltransferase n=2 Tax=Raineyella fluvialis TaxID=2662261 RepID=A0A5Q2FE68_9ACTN|nr:glycosyltransferase [Raineyella fluvialis]
MDVLIPTKDRAAALAVTLAGLAAQDDPPFRVVISDQSDTPAEDAPPVATMLRVLRAQGREVDVCRHLPPRGMAEQRQYLLEQARTARVLFLDDDVWLEPGLLARLDEALTRIGGGFVGSAVQGLSHLGDRRPSELVGFEPWGGAVAPETITRDTDAFARHSLHNAANLVHVAADTDLPDDGWLTYRVAWVGGCVLYRRDALEAVGGFDFWRRLPPVHVGEDVLAQWRVMRRFGGAGLLPSGAVHLEEPTTLPRRRVEAAEAIGWPSGPEDCDGR